MLVGGGEGTGGIRVRVRITVTKKYMSIYIIDVYIEEIGLG